MIFSVAVVVLVVKRMDSDLDSFVEGDEVIFVVVVVVVVVFVVVKGTD